MEPNLRVLITISYLLWVIVSLLIIESIIEEKIRRYRRDKFIDELESVTEEDLLNCEEVEEKENIFKRIINTIKYFFVAVAYKIRTAKKNLKRKIVERLKED